MARALLSVVKTTHGVKPTFVAVTVANGAKFKNDGLVILALINTHAVNDVTVTIPTPKTLTSNNLTVQDLSFAVVHSSSPGNTYFTRFFDTDIYNQADEYVHINVDLAGVSVVVLKPD